MSRPVPEASGAPALDALHLAYPDLQVSTDGAAVSADGETWVTFRGPPPASPEAALANPSPADQFMQVYPLGDDLSGRTQPYFDPGRFRNQRLFGMLWFASEGAARQSLVRVPFGDLADAAVMVTSHRGVDCQLGAVLDRLRASEQDLSRYFRQPGGGFNWRRISGTDRLSAHSYGIAVDLNAELGGYWRWTGAEAGNVGPYENRIPAEIVAAFETYGFIWGGKWHHFDGMHFEYRPELILHSRIVQGTR